jgi:hypothetical protein
VDETNASISVDESSKYRPGDLIDISNATISTGPWAARQPDLGVSFDDQSMGSNSRPTSSLANASWGSQDLGTPRRAFRASERKQEISAEDGTRRGEVKRVKLDTILDNCVILEELIKELVAVMNARKALGIDQVGWEVDGADMDE